jgi:hypothetical protein
MKMVFGAWETFLRHILATPGISSEFYVQLLKEPLPGNRLLVFDDFVIADYPGYSGAALALNAYHQYGVEGSYSFEGIVCTDQGFTGPTSGGPAVITGFCVKSYIDDDHQSYIAGENFPFPITLVNNSHNLYIHGIFFSFDGRMFYTGTALT